MENSITQKSKNIKRYLPHEVKTREYAVKMYRNCGDIEYVCRKYHISRVSLWRWNKKYDGTRESLADKSHRPHSKHPTEHTEQEIKWIKDLIKRNPNITLNEIWYKLKINKGYKRKPASLYRVLRKIGYYTKPEIKGTSKKHDKEYETPKNIGEKWQIDVKYVPNECKTKDLPGDKRFYQYTCIDEASRERYLYWYEEHAAADTVDFIKRCIRYYGYKTKEIQTDNGAEFTYNKADIKREHAVEKLLKELEIKHHKIRPRTPEHNGKVERSHRNDNERFYSYLKFYSFEDLKKQGAEYLKRTNKIPMAVLGYMTPREKRAEIDLSNPVAVYNYEPESVTDKIVYYVLELNKASYIKRVIAVEGDRVQIKNGKVYVNGKLLKEDYLPEGTTTKTVYYNDITVPEGYVYVMGDNRDESMDSRTFGCIPVDKIEGKVVFRYWPLSEFGGI